jgi:hypothetical protein
MQSPTFVFWHMPLVRTSASIRASETDGAGIEFAYAQLGSLRVMGHRGKCGGGRSYWSRCAFDFCAGVNWSHGDMTVLRMIKPFVWAADPNRLAAVKRGKQMLEPLY